MLVVLDVMRSLLTILQLPNTKGKRFLYSLALSGNSIFDLHKWLSKSLV